MPPSERAVRASATASLINGRCTTDDGVGCEPLPAREVRRTKDKEPARELRRVGTMEVSSIGNEPENSAFAIIVLVKLRVNEDRMKA